MPELTDAERVALLTSRLGLPEGALRHEVALEALRHGSFVHERRLAGEVMESNERLEFLGDAVLGLAVSMRCFERHPLAAEGDLTRLRASIVKAESLAQVARELGLGELLLLGRGEERTGGREKQSLLADALEAVVAAVYLSRGLQRLGEQALLLASAGALLPADARSRACSPTRWRRWWLPCTCRAAATTAS